MEANQRAYELPFKHSRENARVGSEVKETKVTRDATGRFVSKGHWEFAITMIQ